MSRERNRSEFPALASLVDAFREAGMDVRMVHGEEGGREIGKRPGVPAGCIEMDFFAAMDMAAMGQPKGRKA